MPHEFHFVAKVCLEINTARGEFKNLASAVLRNCVITIRATQATLNDALVCIEACRRSLCKSQRDQQGRYSD